MNTMTITAKSRSLNPEKFLRNFCECPQKVRKDPYRVGLLPSQVWEGFVNMPTPFAKEFWVVEKDGEVLGRVGASCSASYPGTGYVGFFDVNVMHSNFGKVPRLLLDTALGWLKEQGMKTVYGPLNFNTWFPYRLRTGEQDELRFSWEPVNPPEYVKYFTDAGFVEDEKYHSQATEGLDAVVDKTKPGHDAALAAGYSYRGFDAENLLTKEVPILYDISMAGFKDNFLFEPIPLEAFTQLYVPVANKIDTSLARFVVDPAGKEVGFFFIFADQEYLVLKSVAVKPEARGKGLSNGLVHEAALEAFKRGITKCISALVKSGAQSESYAKKAAPLWTHEYALFKKEL